MPDAAGFPKTLDTIVPKVLTVCRSDFHLPIIAHSAWSGPLVREPDPAMAPSVLFGFFTRLAGADVSALPGFSGRFGTMCAASAAVARALQKPLGDLREAFVMPGGGLTFDTIPAFLNSSGATRSC